MLRNREIDSVGSQTPWYRDGLRFECTRCGQCCSGSPGTVLVSDQEIDELARHVSLSVEEFRAVYTRTLRKGEISLREKRSKECVFFDRDRGCSIYKQRPRQCRTWPFWRGVVASEERWNEEAEGCPGMNRGKLRDAAEVARTSSADGTSGFVPIVPDLEPTGVTDA
ncbi:MAG: YkgJ family cysteine cluster protein [Myxococcota bacterium]